MRLTVAILERVPLTPWWFRRRRREMCQQWRRHLSRYYQSEYQRG
jgi:hypothetical protein